jgi:hypothetical protein
MDQSEGSLESKHDLADKAAECLMEFGAVSKFVVVNSAFHENMGRSIQNFVSLDSNIEGSLKCLYSTIRAMSDLHIQADRIKRCIDELPNVQAGLEACNSIASVPSSKKHN